MNRRVNRGLRLRAALMMRVRRCSVAMLLCWRRVSLRVYVLSLHLLRHVMTL